MFKPSKSIVGLDIGSSAIKAVELSRVGKEVQVTGFGQIELASEDPKDVVAAITELMREGGFRTKNVVTSVSGKMVIIRYLSMVPMSDEELRNAILFEAEKYIPFTLDECVLDCQRFDEPEGGNSANVLLVAVKDAVLDHHLGLVQKAGLTPDIIDVDAFALSNAHSLLRSCNGQGPEEGVIAFVDVGATKTSLNIVRNGVSLFTREIYFGGKDLTQSIARRLAIDEQEAEFLKRSPGEEYESVKEAVFPTIDDLGNELQLSFDYFESQNGCGPERILLSGGASRFSFFRESFERIFEKPTGIFNPFEGLPVSEDIDQDLLASGGPQLVVAAGLASRIRKV